MHFNYVELGLIWIAEHKKVLTYTILVGILLVYTGSLAYRDVKRDPISCEVDNATASAIVVLKELNLDLKQIKGTLQVPQYVPQNDQLLLDYVTPGSGKDRNYDHLVSFDCDHVPAEKGPWYKFNLPYQSESFIYPFENYEVNLSLELRKSDQPKLIKLQVINLIEELRTSDCNKGFLFEKSSDQPNTFHIILRRHRFVTTITLILAIVALMFLVYIAFKEEKSKVPANSLGYLAALWGIHQIIIGSVKIFPTIVDYVTLGLYMIVATIVVYRWLFSPNVEPVSQYKRYSSPKIRSRLKTTQPESSGDRPNRWQSYE